MNAPVAADPVTTGCVIVLIGRGDAASVPAPAAGLADIPTLAGGGAGVGAAAAGAGAAGFGGGAARSTTGSRTWRGAETSGAISTGAAGSGARGAGAGAGGVGAGAAAGAGARTAVPPAALLERRRM